MDTIRSTFSRAKYINPFTDFGFKRLFGEEFNKDLLIDFLNALFEEKGEVIVDLTYLKNEHLGRSEIDRRAIFDLYCENQKGEKFIVEMQKTKQNFFKDRTVYYATFPIQEQAAKEDWNYELKAVYTIGILDFVFDEDKNDPDKFRYDIKLSDIDTNKIFYEKLTFVYLEMPKFKKTEDELVSNFDKWLYFLRHLNRLDEIPERLRNRIFEKAFSSAEIAKFTKDQFVNYEESLKQYRDLKNSLDTAFDDGKVEGEQIGIAKGEQIGIAKGEQIGIAKSKREIAINLLGLNLSHEQIAAATGLTLAEIELLGLETL